MLFKCNLAMKGGLSSSNPRNSSMLICLKFVISKTQVKQYKNMLAKTCLQNRFCGNRHLWESHDNKLLRFSTASRKATRYT